MATGDLSALSSSGADSASSSAAGSITATARPTVTTVSIDGNEFDATSAHVNFGAAHDEHGMPLAGSMITSISVSVDMHDNVNMPFDVLTDLFDLVNVVTTDKIVPIKLTFWTDESHQDALCTYSFDGWMCNFSISSSSNHTLNMSIQPSLDSQAYANIQMGN